MHSNVVIDELKRELANKNAIVQCAREFNVVGDPTRLKICYLLCRHQELSVGEIAKVVGVSISAVSHTLKKLQKANIVQNRKRSRAVYYQLKPSPITSIIKERFSNL